MNNLLLMILILVFSACGPMNEKDPGSDLLQKTRVGAGATVSTKSGSFYVVACPEGHPNAPIQKEKSIPVGDHIFQVRFVNTNALKGPSNDAKISATLRMPAMPDMEVEQPAPAERLGDESFKIGLFFSMPGAWELLLSIEDQGVKDTLLYEINVQ